MIDFVVIRAGQRVFCRDVQVMREENCWTDHMLGRAKLDIVVTCDANKKDKSHTPFAAHKLSTEAARKEFRKSLEELLMSKPHMNDGTPEERTGKL